MSQPKSGELLLLSPPSVGEFLQNPEAYSLLPLHEPSTPDESTILIMSIKTDNDVAVRRLIEARRSIDWRDSKGFTALTHAAQKGRTQYVQLLLGAGAQPDARTDTGSTPLIQASHFGHYDVVIQLLKFGAKPDKFNEKGTTSLMRAAQEGHLGVVQLLVQQNANVNARNKERMNALMLASQRGHTKIVELLIKSGAGVDNRTIQGSTALILACKRGHADVVKVLLREGAELSIVDSRGRAARHAALRREEYDIAQMLNPAFQNYLMKMKVRTERSFVLVKLYHLVHQNRAVPIYGKPSIFHWCPLTRPRKEEETEGDHDDVDVEIDGSADQVDIEAPGSCKSKRSISNKRKQKRLYSDKPTTNSLQYLQPPKKQRKRYSTQTPSHPLTSFPTSKHNSTNTNSKNPESTTYKEAPIFVEYLYRALNLPQRVFHHIVEFIPLPRLWDEMLNRLNRKSRYNPNLALTGAFEILDEVFDDLLLVKEKSQPQRSLKFRDNSILLTSLLQKGFPSNLLVHLRQWADTQSVMLKLNTQVHFEPTVASQLLALVADVVRWFNCYEWNNFHRRRLNSPTHSSSFHGTAFPLSPPQNGLNFDHAYFPKQYLSVASIPGQFPFHSPLTPLSDSDYFSNQNVSFPSFSTFSSTSPIFDLFFFLNHPQSSPPTESQAQFQLANQQMNSNINQDENQDENQGIHLSDINHNEDSGSMDNNNNHDDGHDDNDIDDNDEEEEDDEDDDTNDLHSSIDHFTNFDPIINFQNNNNENEIGDNIQIHDVENEIDDIDEYDASSDNDDEINHGPINENIAEDSQFIEENNGVNEEESTNSNSENDVDDIENDVDDDDEVDIGEVDIDEVDIDVSGI